MAVRIYRCPYLVSNQRPPPSAPPKCDEALCLLGGTYIYELAPFTDASAYCLPFSASQKRLSALSSRWRPRETVPICHYLLSVYPSVPSKCGEAPFVPAAHTQDSALCHRPRLVPNQWRPQMR